LPDPDGPGRRPALAWKLVAAFAAGALVAGIAVAVLVGSHGSTTPRPKHIDASAIAMGDATGATCGPVAAPGVGHPDPLLSQLFNVHDGAGTAYLLGWQIVPFRGSGRTYRFGTGGNLLALEPPTGGRPVGFGQGTVTFTGSADAGTIDAVLKLTAGGSLTVGGSWTCATGTSASTVVPTSAPPQ
jgi:hypothetical protein